MVDYLTDFFEVSRIPLTTTAAVINACKEQFARHGIPEVVHTDGGPQFMSYEFGKFAKAWEFVHSVSAPYHSRSNGKAEAAVKIAKRLLKRSQDPYLALLEWRNTPTVDIDTSPCQRLLGRRTRSVVPIHRKKLESSTVAKVWEKKLERQSKIQEHQHKQGKNLPPLQVGEPVLVKEVRGKKSQWNRGYCLEKLSGQSYVVEVEDKLLHRNREFLKPSKNLPAVHTELEEYPEPEVSRSAATGPGLVTEQVVPNQSNDGATATIRTNVLPTTEGVNVGLDHGQGAGTPVVPSSQPGGDRLVRVPRGRDLGPSVAVPTTTRSGRVVRKPERYKDFVKM